MAPEVRLSPDGNWWWDGTTWKPAISPDAQWRWNGASWYPIGLPAPSSSGLSGGAIGAAVAVGLVVVLVTVSVLAFVAFNRANTPAPTVSLSSPSPNANPSLAAAVPCDHLEHTEVHYHAFLQILDRGKDVPIPTNLGRTGACFYWMHMHTAEPGIVHLESPADHAFTLGDFFSVWAAWSERPQPIDRTHVSSYTLTGDEQLVVYVDIGDGTGPQLFTGSPQTIVLKSHEVITLEITPPDVNPPPPYTWPPGF